MWVVTQRKKVIDPIIKMAYKALQLTSQYAVSLRYTLHCRSTELKRYCDVQLLVLLL